LLLSYCIVSCTFLVLIATGAYLGMNKETSVFEQWHCLRKVCIMANRWRIPLSERLGTKAVDGDGACLRSLVGPPDGGAKACR